LFKIVPKTLDLIVRDGCDSCTVTCTFKQDGALYKVIRKYSIKSNKSELMLEINSGFNWIPIDDLRGKDTETFLKELIKINFDAFRNSVLFEQGTFAKLAEGSDIDRRKILKEPLQLAIYSIYEKTAKVKLSQAEKDLEKNKTLIESLGSPSEDIISIIADVNRLQAQTSILEQQRLDLKKTLVLLRSQISDQEKLLTSDAAQIADQLVKLDEQKQKHKENIKKLEAQESSNKKDQAVKSAEIVTQQKLLEEKIQEQSKINEIILREEKVILKDIAELDAKEQRGNKYLASQEAEYDKYSKHLPAGSQCDVCFNELTDEYRDKIAAENVIKAQKAKGIIAESQVKLSKIKQKKKSLYDEIKDNNNSQRTRNDLIDKIVSIKNKIASLEQFAKSSSELISKISLSLMEEKESLVTVEEKEKILHDSSKDFSVAEINKKIVSLKSDLRGKEATDNEMVRNISSAAASVGIAEEKLRKRTEDKVKLEELNTNKPGLERIVRKYSRAVRAFSPAGIPTLIIHTILDDLQIEANKVLQDFRPDMTLRFSVDKDDKDALGIIYTINGKVRNYMMMGGGQKMFIAFALRLGLSKVIQKRLDVNIPLLEMDEVDQPMDKAGKDAFVEAVRKYQEQYKIFVITHDDRLKDKFNYAILVENDGDKGSVGRLVSSW
jgi:DNA repair exonuclease SbcCD ATPase subunit